MFKLCPPIVANHFVYKCLQLTALPHMNNVTSFIPLKLPKQEHGDLSAKKGHLKY